MKISIVGAGWYGCHVAKTLKGMGHTVQISEKSDRVLSKASRNNQNRLHLGFHYPRDSKTRQYSKEGFDWFLRTYADFVETVENNYYAVANENSIVDFETYKLIVSGSGLNFTEAEMPDFKNISPLLKCDEMLIKNEDAALFFEQELRSVLVKNHTVDIDDEEVLSSLKQEFDYIIDCSWGTAKKLAGVDYFYEPCIFFLYRNTSNKHFALTIMDGEHYSLYPYSRDVYTLTSVKNTPL